MKKMCYIILVIFIVIGGGIAGLVILNNDDLDNSTSIVDNINTELTLNAESISISEFVEENNQEVVEDIKEPNYLIFGDFTSDGVVTEIEKQAMASNTEYLQRMIDEAQAGQIIELPAGVFYFASGGENARGVENYVIMLRSYVSIVGAGTDESDSNKSTILKPYADAGTIKYGLDMFYYNELADYNNPEYLEDVNFSDFIIDGEKVRGNDYNTSGKGFMINLCRNCHWKNIIVRNTDATGFGMDNPINCSIIDCVAINCGKNAEINDYGASGFGVGTGYSNEESMYISNCRSTGNRKYGFFFEHQGRFDTRYGATKAEGFIVEDSYASGNLYNFGGERSNDVIYINCKSDSNKDTKSFTKSFINFSGDSRRMNMINMDFDLSFTDLDGISDESREAIYWSIENDVISSKSTTVFGRGDYSTRGEAILYLWRLAGRPGDVILYRNGNVDINSIFADVSNDADYAAAVKWGHNVKIVTGTGNSFFTPNKVISRAEFVTFLWRMAGRPKTNYVAKFSDVDKNSYYYDAVNWANENKVLMGIRTDYFGAVENCTKEQIAIFLYRYQKMQGQTYNITYNLMHGSVSKQNPDSYKSGTDKFILSNPTREGYTFIGWKGSNNIKLTNSISIDKNATGNKAYYALYDANEYTIYYDANGGKGSMDATSVIYDKYVALSKNEFTKEGYIFAGWSEIKNGPIDYTDKEIVKNLVNIDNGKITLYAVWEKIEARTNIFVGASLIYEMHSVIGDGNGDIWSAKRGAGLEWLKTTGIPSIDSQIVSNVNLIIAASSNELFNPAIVGSTQADCRKVVNNYIDYFKENAFKWKEKGANIYLLSASPVVDEKITEDRLVNSAAIKQFNDLMKSELKNKANGLTFIKYIDTYSALVDDVSSKDLLRDDGTHGTALYYSMYYSVIKKYLNQSYIPTYEAIANMKDISKDDSNYQAIKWGYENVYIDPETSTKFNSSGNITRGEAIELIWRSQRMPYSAATSKFKISDVKNTDTEYTSVVWAVENDIAYGYSDKIFSPDSLCSRKEILTFIWRLAGKPVSNKKYNIDGVTKNEYFYEAVNWAISEGLIDYSENNQVDFNQYCTRGEIVNILYNYYN